MGCGQAISNVISKDSLLPLKWKLTDMPVQDVLRIGEGLLVMGEIVIVVVVERFPNEVLSYT
jgi:hypothetical protein